MVDLLGEVLGDWAAEALRAPFCIGTTDELDDLLRRAFGDVVVKRHERQGAFRVARRLAAHRHPGLDALRGTSTTSSSRELRRAATERLARFVGADGAVSFAAPALIATATAA